MALAAPAALYLVVGTVPALAGVQRWLGSKTVFAAFIVVSMLGLAWLVWGVFRTVRALPRVRRLAYGEPAARAIFHTLTGAGAVAAGAVGVRAWLEGKSARSHILINAHILDALGTALMITALAIALAALIFFPPVALVELAGVGTALVVTEAAAVSVPALVTAGVLGSYGLMMSEAAEGSSGERSAARARRLEDLSRDPAHGGRSTPGSQQEARVGLELEEAGRAPGPIRRDPTGGAEFQDTNGQYWDVKGFNSNFPPNRGGYDLNSSMQKIADSLRDGENVMLDTSKMSPEAVQELRAAVDATEGWAGRVLWWP